MLESMNYGFRNPKNIIWIIYRIKQLGNYKKIMGSSEDPSLVNNVDELGLVYQGLTDVSGQPIGPIFKSAVISSEPQFYELHVRRYSPRPRPVRSGPMSVTFPLFLRHPWRILWPSSYMKPNYAWKCLQNNAKSGEYNLILSSHLRLTYLLHGAESFLRS